MSLTIVLPIQNLIQIFKISLCPTNCPTNKLDFVPSHNISLDHQTTTSLMPLSYYLYRLRVRGTFSQKGFGFTCMQLTINNNITGTLFYESANSVILEFTGKEEDVNRVLEKCKQANYINEILILNKTKPEKKINDFIMLNQID